MIEVNKFRLTAGVAGYIITDYHTKCRDEYFRI